MTQPPEAQAHALAGARAEAALTRYWAAWDLANFDAYVASSTPAMRESLGVTDGDSFAAAAADYAESVADMRRAVIEIALSGDDLTEAIVLSEESARDGSEYVTEHLRHRLVLVDDTWLVDEESVID
ncbi:hypothetical protein [Demequina globuliformis]|uniref:hypothetical protein n=1 Tax=Demequina globuliformis TaxID=676202 RepID=UPI000780F5D6|nr:hypothetical protein [Demequina globuliformis]